MTLFSIEQAHREKSTFKKRNPSFNLLVSLFLEKDSRTLEKSRLAAELREHTTLELVAFWVACQQGAKGAPGNSSLIHAFNFKPTTNSYIVFTAAETDTWGYLRGAK